MGMGLGNKYKQNGFIVETIDHIRVVVLAPDSSGVLGFNPTSDNEIY